MLTAKKDGSLKLALNAKPMNAQIWQNKYQMPNMHKLIDLAAQIITRDTPGKVWFTSLDLKYAFSQLPLSDQTSSHCNFSILCGQATGTYRFKTGFYRDGYAYRIPESDVLYLTRIGRFYMLP